MTAVSFPPSLPSQPEPGHDGDTHGGLEPPCELRPGALVAALVAGGVAWYGLVSVVVWAL